MASAYELMLILRGRNYLSNDLRRASSDLSRMQARQLAGQRLTVAQQQKLSQIIQKKDDLRALEARAIAVEHIGRAFQTVGFFATAAFGAAAAAAAKFQTESAMAATQAITAGHSSLGEVLRSGNQISQNITNLLASGGAVASPTEYQKATYDVLSGIPQIQGTSLQRVRQASSLIKELNQVAKANYGLVDFNGVTQAAITLVDTFHIRLKDLPAAFDNVQAAVNRGRLTMEQYVTGLNTAAPAAKQAGYNLRQMDATLSFLSTKFPNYTRATIGYARLLDVLANPKFIAAMRANGVQITDITGKHLLPFETIIERLVKRWPQLAQGGTFAANFIKAMSGATGTIQARRALTVSAQDVQGLTNFSRELPRLAPGLVSAQAKVADATTQVKWKEFVNQLHAVVLEIGVNAIPVFKALIGPIQKAVEWFDKLSPHTRKLIGEIGAISSVSVLFIGTIGVLIGSFTRMYAVFRLFTLGRGGLLSAESGFIRAGTAMRVGLIGAILVVLPLLLKYHDQISRVTGGLIGFQGALRLISAILAVMTMRTLINNMVTLGGAASTTAGELGLVQRNLALINGYVAVATIIIIYRRQIKDFVNRTADKLFGWLPGSHWDPTSLERRMIPGLAWLQDKSQGVINILTFGTARDLQRQKNLANATANTMASQTEDLAAKVRAARARVRRAARDARDPTTGGGAAPAPFTDADVLAAVKNIVKLDDLARRKSTLKNFEAANAALNDLQSKASKQQFAAAQDLISALESQDKAHTKKAVDEEKKRERLLAAERKRAMQNAQREITQAAQSLQSSYQQMYQQNQTAFGTLFQGPVMTGARMQNRLQWGGRVTGQDLLRDIKAQVFQFRMWRNLINRLAKAGAPQELINQIMAGGPSTMPEVRALLSLGKTDLRSYFRTFERGQELIQVATKRDLTRQLGHYRKYGQNIALAIIQGLRDEQVPMLNYFEKIIMKMFPGLTKRAGGVAAGTHHGGIHEHPHPAGSVRPTRGRGGTRITPTPESRFSGPHTVHYHVHTSHVDTSTALRKARNFHKATYGSQGWVGA